MANKTYCTLTFQDANKKKTTRSFRSRDDNPSDGNVEALAEAMQGLTKLSVVKAQVSREVDITAQTEDVVAGATRERQYAVKFQMSRLRNSGGGEHTFNIPDLQDALTDANNDKIVIGAAEFGAWRELFDDGAGIAAVQGNWYVSDDEELVEEVDPIEGGLI